MQEGSQAAILDYQVYLRVLSYLNFLSNLKHMSNLLSVTGNDPEEIEEALTSLHMGPHQHDQSGGGEFIGDGIRMHEQPLVIGENRG